MADNAKLDELAERAKALFSDEIKMLLLLDPCTKLVFTVQVVRGQVKVVISHSMRIAKQKGADLVDERPLTHADWTEILSLGPFSETPERESDKPLRQILLKTKEDGIAPYKAAFTRSPMINEVLRAHGKTFRMINTHNKYEMKRII